MNGVHTRIMKITKFLNIYEISRFRASVRHGGVISCPEKPVMKTSRGLLLVGGIYHKGSTGASAFII